MFFKHKSKKVVLSRFFVLISALFIGVSFQAKEPSLLDIQVIDFDESASLIVALQDTSFAFFEVEVPPQPQDGIQAFMKSINNSYVFSKEAKEANVEGRLVLTFIVERDGQLSDIRAIQDLGYGTGEEAVRVFKNSPKWRPGIQGGRPVRVQYTLVISIGGKIQSDNALQVVYTPVPTIIESNTQTPSGTKSEANNPLLLQVVNEPPAPIDGMRSLLTYIGAHYEYPEEAINARVKGQLMLAFRVEKDGSLSNIKVLEDLGFGTGEEAIRVLKDGPKWKPCIYNGKPVSVNFNLPIVLNSEGDDQ